MPAGLTRALMRDGGAGGMGGRGGGVAANNRCLTEAAKLSGGRKASKWAPGEYALHGDP